MPPAGLKVYSVATTPAEPVQTADPPLVLDEAEVRRVVRLLVDALAPDDGLSALIGGDGWLWFRFRLGPEGGPPANLDYQCGGAFDDRALAAFTHWSFEVDFEPPDFPEAKRLVATGEHRTRARPGLVGDAAWKSDPRVADVAALTPRQRQVLVLLIDALSVKQIARQLSLSTHTVNDDCKVIHRRSGVNRRGELLRKFMSAKP